MINTNDDYIEIAGVRTKSQVTCNTVKRYQSYPGKACWVECKSNSKGRLFIDGSTSEPRLKLVPGVIQTDDNGIFKAILYNISDQVLTISDQEIMALKDTEFMELAQKDSDENFDINKVITGLDNPKRISKLKKLLWRFRDRFREKTGPIYR